MRVHFGALVVTQTAHSIEEYFGRLSQLNTFYLPAYYFLTYHPPPATYFLR